MRFLPAGQQHRGERHGRCRLCRTDGQLSKTHVPPKGAGNSGDARPAVQRVDSDGMATLDFGRASKGGMWGYWFCIDCNGRTGVWDERYIDLHQRLLLHLHDGPERPRQKLMGELENLDVGAVARSMWAWSFALVPGMADRYPDLAEAVRTGEPVEPPGDIELLLGVTMDLRIWAIGQQDAVVVVRNLTGERARPSGLVVPGPTTDPLPLTAVGSPPFSVVLAHVDRPTGIPHTSVNEWLRDPAGVRRKVVLDLPMVETLGADSPSPMTYGRFVPARTEPS